MHKPFSNLHALVIASNNKHKVEEIRQLFHEHHLSIQLQTMQDIDCYDDIAETAETIEGNASLKSVYIADKFMMNCFADDTGLLVDALAGAPGVYSARYAGEQKSDADNCNKLLKELEISTNRQAHFKTVISLQWNKKEYLFEGIIHGTIADSPRGNNGFGYDPLFIPRGETKTFAEMTHSEKNKMSHRAIAINKLLTFLKTVL